MKAIIIILALVLAGCSQQQIRPYGGASCPVASPGQVRVLYSFPTDPHQKVGSISIRHSKPGFSDPTVADAEHKIKQAGFDLGAEAVVIVHSNQTGARQVFITAEAVCLR